MSNSDTKTIEELKDAIRTLESSIDLSLPHDLNQKIAQISVHLASLAEFLPELKESYLELRTTYYDDLRGAKVKHTPAKERLQFVPEIQKAKSELEALEKFIESKQNLVIRMEKYLQGLVSLERKDI